MQESTLTVNSNNVDKIPFVICSSFNVAPLVQHIGHVWRFSGDLLHDDTIVLIQCTLKDPTNTKGQGQIQVQVNCEDFMLGGHLVELAKKVLAAAS